MTVLQPFLDIIASLYAAYQAVAAATTSSAKLLAGLNFVGFTVYLPAAISNAPQALSALENLSDADRQAMEAQLAGKLTGVDAAVVAKVVAGLDIVIRGGAVVADVVALFKSATAASTAVASSSQAAAPSATPAV